MTGHVAVRRQKRRERIRPGHGPEDIRRPGLRPRVLLLAVLACACVLALGAGSAQADIAGLPDNRAYEMVTPPNKDSGEPFDRGGFTFGVNPAAVDGNRLAYLSFNPFPGSPSFGSYYMATRGSSNWSSVNVIPPQSVEHSLLCGALASDMSSYSQDLSKVVISDGFGQDFGCGKDSPPLVPNAVDGHQEPANSSNLFLRDNVTGNYYLVNVTPSTVNCTLSDLSAGRCIAVFDAGSADLSHVVFDETTTPGLTGDAPPGVDNLYEWVKSTDSVRLVTYLPNGTPEQGALAGGSTGNAFHAVSDDGSVIFFTSGGNLYVRIAGTSTQQVDAPAAGASGPGGGGQFVAASSDGSKVFFTDDASAGLTTDTQSGSGTNLYEYDVAANTLTDLTPGSDVEVQGFSGSSDDGSYIYFVANGALANGATSGQPNLYVIHGGMTTFIATLGGSDGCDWQSFCLSARVSANGLYLGFTSSQSLTGFNSGGNAEIYRYDAASNNLVCASCNPNGVTPMSSTAINAPQQPFESFAAIDEYLQRQVSDNGQVFFNTAESLLPFDSNGQEDAYEYENGTLSLLSTGTSPDPSLFWDASASGNDAFVATSQQLVAQDTDGSVDIYDARVGGGFPASAPAPVCNGANCKPPAPTTPPPPIFGTVTFFGPGNATHHATGRVMLLRKVVKSRVIRLLVRVPGKGRITASGRLIRTTRRRVPMAGNYVLTVRLNARGKRELKHKRKLRLAIHVRYQPPGGASSLTVKLTVKA